MENAVSTLDTILSSCSPSTVLPPDGSALWMHVLDSLRSRMDGQLFVAYIRPLRLEVFDKSTGSVALSAPSKLVRDRVEAQFSEKIRGVMSEVLALHPDQLQLRIAVRERDSEDIRASEDALVVRRVAVSKSENAGAGRKSSAISHEDAAKAAGISTKYTFSSFVVGNSNQFCHAAAMRVAEEPGKSYNPFFIYGGVGLGKTHLLHAIGNVVLERNPSARVLYMSSESFTNELIQALRNAKMDEFKTRLRNIELLLIDDIQFMCGKERTQEEFFHTFNALYNAKHQIVITSDKLPHEIPGLEERLQTRFAWGLTADLQAPDFETRVAILKRKAALDGSPLPEDVAHFIAERVSSNVRELEGAFTRLHAASSLQRQPITLPFATSVLKPLFAPVASQLGVDDIKRVVAQRFTIKVSDMISKRRTKNLSFPRHIAMYLCRKHTTMSYPEIGNCFGGRDHSSVIHAANVVANKISRDDELRMVIREIEQALLNR
ncbi:MAG: chromosomal replication initiator protein DnaA [Bdellovibrionota bacterium]|nr:MAG: chromosomal replication initiator protein DnaA [Bdellovibrionota bacterium]